MSAALPLCAIADLHGDLVHTLEALRLCGLVDEHGHWSAGSRRAVQLGDVLDRGNASIATLEKLWELRDEAAAAGGEFTLLIGNHELMNMQGRLFYVHGYARRGGQHSGELARIGGEVVWRQRLDPHTGDIGRRLVDQPAVVVRGEGECRTMFVHAGVRFRDAEKYKTVEALNRALREQILQGSGELLDSREGPLWWRGYARPHGSGARESDICKEIKSTAELYGARRMAVGHNIVPWISTRCAGTLQMLDVGMSSAYGGQPTAWRCDLIGGEARIRALYPVHEEAPPELCSRCSLASPLSRDWSECRDYCQR